VMMVHPARPEAYDHGIVTPLHEGKPA
jgi:hypothetical protein